MTLRRFSSRSSSSHLQRRRQGVSSPNSSSSFSSSSLSSSSVSSSFSSSPSSFSQYPSSCPSSSLLFHSSFPALPLPRFSLVSPSLASSSIFHFHSSQREPCHHHMSCRRISRYKSLSYISLRSLHSSPSFSPSSSSTHSSSSSSLDLLPPVPSCRKAPSYDARSFRRSAWKLQKRGELAEGLLSLPHVSWRSFLKYLHVSLSTSLSLRKKDLSSVPYVCKHFHVSDFRVIDHFLASSLLSPLSEKLTFSSFSSSGVRSQKPSLSSFISSLDDWRISHHPYHRYAIQRFLSIVSSNLPNYTAKDLILLIDGLSSSSSSSSFFSPFQRDRRCDFYHSRQYPVEVLEEVEVTMALLYVHLEKRLYEELRRRQQETTKEEEEEGQETQDTERHLKKISSPSLGLGDLFTRETHGKTTFLERKEEEHDTGGCDDLLLTEVYEILTRGLPMSLSTSSSSFFSPRHISTALLSQENRSVLIEEKRIRQEKEEKERSLTQLYGGPSKMIEGDMPWEEGEGQLTCQRRAFLSYLRSISCKEEEETEGKERHVCGDYYSQRLESIRRKTSRHPAQERWWLAETAKNVLTWIEHEILTTRQDLLSSSSFSSSSPSPLLLHELALLIKGASSSSSLALAIGRMPWGVCTPEERHGVFSSRIVAPTAQDGKTQQEGDVKNKQKDSLATSKDEIGKKADIENPLSATNEKDLSLSFSHPNVMRPLIEGSRDVGNEILQRLFLKRNLQQKITGLGEFTGDSEEGRIEDSSLLLFETSTRENLLYAGAFYLPQAYLSRFAYITWKQLQDDSAYIRRKDDPKNEGKDASIDGGGRTPQNLLASGSPPLSLLIPALPLFARTLSRLVTYSDSPSFASETTKDFSFFNTSSCSSRLNKTPSSTDKTQTRTAMSTEDSQHLPSHTANPITESKWRQTSIGEREEAEERKADPFERREKKEEMNPRRRRRKREMKRGQEEEKEETTLSELYVSPVIWFRRVLKTLRITLEKQKNELVKMKKEEEEALRVKDGIDNENLSSSSLHREERIETRPASRRPKEKNGKDLSAPSSFQQMVSSSSSLRRDLSSTHLSFLHYTLESYLAARIYTKLTCLYLQKLERIGRDKRISSERRYMYLDSLLLGRYGKSFSSLSQNSVPRSTAYSVVRYIRRQLDVCSDIGVNHLKEAIRLAGSMLPASILSRLVLQDLSLSIPSSGVYTPRDRKSRTKVRRSRTNQRGLAVPSKYKIDNDLYTIGRKRRNDRKESVSELYCSSSLSEDPFFPRNSERSVSSFNTSLHTWLVPHIMAACPLHLSALYYHLLISRLLPASHLYSPLRSRQEGQEGGGEEQEEKEMKKNPESFLDRSLYERQIDSDGEALYLQLICQLGRHLLERLKGIRREYEQRCRITKDQQEKILISLPQFQKLNRDLILRDGHLDYTRFDQYLNLQKEPSQGLHRTRDILHQLKMINQHASRASASLRDFRVLPCGSRVENMEEMKEKEDDEARESRQDRGEEEGESSMHGQLGQLVTHVAYCARRCLYTAIIQSPIHRKSLRAPCRGEMEWITQQALAMIDADHARKHEEKTKKKKEESIHQIGGSRIEVLDIDGRTVISSSGSSVCNEKDESSVERDGRNLEKESDKNSRLSLFRNFLKNETEVDKKEKESEEEKCVPKDEGKTPRRWRDLGQQDGDETKQTQLQSLLRKVYPDTGPIACDLQSPPRIVRAKGYARRERHRRLPIIHPFEEDGHGERETSYPLGVFERYALLRGHRQEKKRNRRTEEERKGPEIPEEKTEERYTGEDENAMAKKKKSHNRLGSQDDQEKDESSKLAEDMRKERVMIRSMSSSS
ncbi:hypothetical protein CSUI_002703 [Cystoisospora suis]|uniref:Uncharacterized protein n=1 Tax=Cystoisospora suis TaxID=483139 RepID=A0A2C6L8D7_9APIC|nr:hypothetical protein CSUI_002703 [Cystoisospora suis]